MNKDSFAPFVCALARKLQQFSSPSSELSFPSPHSACRDPEVALGFGSVAHAANVDATIQYFGHNFFLITTSKGTRIVTDPLGPDGTPTPMCPLMWSRSGKKC
jgi:hypothetical protein